MSIWSTSGTGRCYSSLLFGLHWLYDTSFWNPIFSSNNFKTTPSTSSLQQDVDVWGDPRTVGRFKNHVTRTTRILRTHCWNAVEDLCQFMALCFSTNITVLPINNAWGRGGTTQEQASPRSVDSHTSLLYSLYYYPFTTLRISYLTSFDSILAWFKPSRCYSCSSWGVPWSYLHCRHQRAFIYPLPTLISKLTRAFDPVHNTRPEK